MRALVILALATLSWSVKIPATVANVADGDTITTMVDGERRKVRLLWIDTPESHDNRHGKAMPEGVKAAEALRSLLPHGAAIRLWGPGDELKVDPFGRSLAVVFLGATGEDSAQEHQIRAGWSPLWEKYGKPPEPWKAKLQAAEDAAKKGKIGAWGTAPDYMRDKANETTQKRR